MRKIREKLKNSCYYVSSNFHPGVQIYITGWVKRKLLNMIKATQKKFHFKVKDVCIMNTHFHIIIHTGKNSDISKIVANFKQKFTQWLNRQFGLSGSAWTDRFFSKIISTITCLEAISNYIAQTPVKEGQSFSPEDYPFYKIWDKNFQWILQTFN